MVATALASLLRRLEHIALVEAATWGRLIRLDVTPLTRVSCRKGVSACRRRKAVSRIVLTRHPRRYAGVASDSGGPTSPRMWVPFSDTRAVLSDSSRVVGYSASEAKRAPTRSATIIIPAEPKRRTS